MSENKLEERFHVGDIVQVIDVARTNVAEADDVSDEFKDFNRDYSHGNLEIYSVYKKDAKYCYRVMSGKTESDEGYYWEELKLIRKKNQQWDN